MFAYSTDGNHPMDMEKLIVQEREEKNLERMFSNRQKWRNWPCQGAPKNSSIVAGEKVRPWSHMPVGG